MGNLINRDDALIEARPEYLNPSQQGHESYNQGWNGAISEYYTGIKALLSADGQTVDCTEFMEWLKAEVLDEENWELNAVANGEIICRKFKKLGWLDVEDGYYVDTRPVGEWVDADGNKVRLDADGHPLDSCWCSNCGEWLVASDEHEVLGKFCPNCGAKMVREDGEEE